MQVQHIAIVLIDLRLTNHPTASCTNQHCQFDILQNHETPGVCTISRTRSTLSPNLFHLNLFSLEGRSRDDVALLKQYNNGTAIMYPVYLRPRGAALPRDVYMCLWGSMAATVFQVPCPFLTVISLCISALKPGSSSSMTTLTSGGFRCCCSGALAR